MAADVHYDLDFDNVSDYAPMKTEARRNASIEIQPITITSRQYFMIGTAPEGVTVAWNFTQRTFADKVRYCVHLIMGRKATEK